MATRPWTPWYKEIREVLGRKTDSLQCSLCQKTYARKLERQLSHLGYEEVLGKRNSGVSLCAKLTPPIRSLFRNCGGRYPRHSGELLPQRSTTPTLETPSSTEHGTPKSTGGDSCVGSTQVPIASSGADTVEPTLPFLPPREYGSIGGTGPRLLRQSVLSEGFQEVERRELDKLWARFFYEANVPFAIARNGAFKEAVMKTAAFGKPYVPPSYHDVRTRLLVQAKTDLEADLNNRTAETVRKFGGTLALDGWTSVSSRPLCNAMLVSPAGELFLGSVDTTGKEKTAEYMASIMDKFIDQVGPHNIVQVCTDNASSMLKASQIVTQKYPHIYIQGCAAHAMDLLLEDWGKATWVKEAVRKAKYLVKFVRNRQMPLAVFRKHEAKFNLLLPGQTRFASNFIMVDRLLKVRAALEQSVVDPDWLAYVTKLRDSRKDKARTLSRTVKKLVQDDHFWERCTNFREMVAPVVYALREFDAKEPCMGKGLHILRNLEKHVLALRNEPFNLATDLADVAERDFYTRKRMITTDLHSAGALLNPYLLHDKDLADDADAITACKRVLGKLCTPENYPDVVNEFIAFRHKTPPFHDMLDPKQQKCSPHAWWDFEGACGKFLAPIAKRILAQTLSSSSCERNWSSYSFVHNKVRNRLLPQRANDLVYVYTNSKLLANGKLTDEKRWYAENLDLEDLQAPSSNNSQDSNGFSSDVDADYNPELLDDAIDSGPPTWTTNIHHGVGNEYDFLSDDDTAAENADDTLPISRYLNGDGLLNSQNILPSRVSPTPQRPRDSIPCEVKTLKETRGVPIDEDSTLLKGKKIEDDGLEGTLSPLPGLHFPRKNSSALKEQAPLHGGASRPLFGSSPKDVTRTNLKSSHGLVSLSKQVRPRAAEAESDNVSSDGNFPLSTLFKNHSGIPPHHNLSSCKAKTALHIKIETAVGNGPSAVGPTHPTEPILKRKAVMQPFALSPHQNPLHARNPLDAIEYCKRFKTIHSTTIKRRIKVEDASNDEDGPSGPSGAEVKGDSDYELPTDINE